MVAMRKYSSKLGYLVVAVLVGLWAAYSFTGFGNANTRCQSIPRVAGADFAGADDAESAGIDADGADLAGAVGTCASVGLLIRQGYERARRGRNDCCAV